jgi:hypothetical protein
MLHSVFLKKMVVFACIYTCKHVCIYKTFKMSNRARCQLLTPVILATQEAEIRRIEVQSQPWANSS